MPKDKFKKSLLGSPNTGGTTYSTAKTGTPPSSTPVRLSGSGGVYGNMNLGSPASTSIASKVAPIKPTNSTPVTLPGVNGIYGNANLGTGGNRSTLSISGSPTLSSVQAEAQKNIGGKPSPYGPIKSSDTSATGTTGTKITSPAGQDYISQLQNMYGQLQNIQAQLPTATSGKDDYKNSPEYKAYLKYQREKENPGEASNAQKNYESSLKTLADIQSKKEQADTEARRRYEEILDTPGMLKAGAEQAARIDQRRSNQELADIALQESAAARTAGVYTDVYGNKLDASKKEGFSLGKDQVRYEWNPETNDYEQVGGGISSDTSYGAYQAGADPVADSWVQFVNGGGDISKVPDEYKNIVVQGLSKTGPGTISPYQQERITRSLTSIDDLMTRVGPWTTGFGALLDVIPSSDARDFEADLAMLKSSIAFGELTAMREASKTGGALGAISEKELQLLESALGSLDTRQSAANFAKNLQQIKDSINRWVSAASQYGGGSGGGFAEVW